MQHNSLPSLSTRDNVFLLGKNALVRNVSIAALNVHTQHVSFFQLLPLKLRDELIHALELTNYEANDVIFREGTPTDSFCVVFSGSLSLFKQSDQTRNPLGKYLASLGPSDCVYLSSFLVKSKREFSVISTDASIIMTLSRKAYEECMARHTPNFIHPYQLDPIISVFNSRKDNVYFQEKKSLPFSQTELDILNPIMNHCPMLYNIPWRYRERIAALFQTRKAVQGEVIFTQGTMSRYAYIVVKGSVSVHFRSKTKKNIILEETVKTSKEQDANQSIVLTMHLHAPLMQGVKKGDIEIVRNIVHKLKQHRVHHLIGAVNHQDAKGNIPIVVACRDANPSMEMIKLLIENKADLNLTNDRDESCLFAAVENNHYYVAELLLAHKATLSSSSLNILSSKLCSGRFVPRELRQMIALLSSVGLHLSADKEKQSNIEKKEDVEHNEISPRDNEIDVSDSEGDEEAISLNNHVDLDIEGGFLEKGCSIVGELGRSLKLLTTCSSFGYCHNDISPFEKQPELLKGMFRHDVQIHKQERRSSMVMYPQAAASRRGSIRIDFSALASSPISTHTIFDDDMYQIPDDSLYHESRSYSAVAREPTSLFQIDALELQRFLYMISPPLRQKQYIIDILSLAPEMRSTSANVDRLSELLGSLSFFDSMSKAIIRRLIPVLEYRQLKPRQVIELQNSPRRAADFFILLNGHVSVFTKSNDSSKVDTDICDLPDYLPKSDLSEILDSNKRYEHLFNAFGKCTDLIAPGHSFGNDNFLKRPSSLITQTTCDVIVINKDAYSNVMTASGFDLDSSNIKHILDTIDEECHDDREVRQKAKELHKSLSNIRFFKDLSKQHRSLVYDSLSYVQLKEGECLFKEESDADEMYILLSGSVSLYIRPWSLRKYFFKMKSLLAQTRERLSVSKSNKILTSVVKKREETQFSPISLSRRGSISGLIEKPKRIRIECDGVDVKTTSKVMNQLFSGFNKLSESDHWLAYFRHWSHERKLPLYGSCVGVIFGGGHFGQHEMMSDARKRICSVIARQDAVLLKLNRRTYLHSVLLLLRDEDQSEMVNEMKSHNLFSRLSELQLIQLASRTHEKILSRNEILIQQGSNAGFLYLILEGECRVTCHVSFQACHCHACNSKYFKNATKSLLHGSGDFEIHDVPDTFLTPQTNTQRSRDMFLVSLDHPRERTGRPTMILNSTNSQRKQPNVTHIQEEGCLRDHLDITVLRSGACFNGGESLLRGKLSSIDDGNANDSHHETLDQAEVPVECSYTAIGDLKVLVLDEAQLSMFVSNNEMNMLDTVMHQRTTLLQDRLHQFAVTKLKEKYESRTSNTSKKLSGINSHILMEQNMKKITKVPLDLQIQLAASASSVTEQASLDAFVPIEEYSNVSRALQNSFMAEKVARSVEHTRSRNVAQTGVLLSLMLQYDDDFRGLVRSTVDEHHQTDAKRKWISTERNVPNDLLRSHKKNALSINRSSNSTPAHFPESIISNPHNRVQPKDVHMAHVRTSYSVIEKALEKKGSNPMDLAHSDLTTTYYHLSHLKKKKKKKTSTTVLSDTKMSKSYSQGHMPTQASRIHKSESSPSFYPTINKNNYYFKTMRQETKRLPPKPITKPPSVRTVHPNRPPKTGFRDPRFMMSNQFADLRRSAKTPLYKSKYRNGAAMIRPATINERLYYKTNTSC